MSRRGVIERFLPLAVGLVGLGIAYHPTLASGLARLQPDLIDNRLINYILEHSYLYICDDFLHARFWDPPFFHPEWNVTAYSDTLLSFAPPYWILRWVGIPPDTAYQLWLMLASTLDYVLAYLLLRRGVVIGPVGASLGAFLYAFGAIRLNQIGNPQLIPHVYTLLTLFALIRAMRETEAARRRMWLVGAVLGVVAELYGAFYLGWFLIVAGLLALPIALVMRSTRGPLWELLRRDGWVLLGAGFLGSVLLVPMLSHYLRAAAEFGPRTYFEVKLSMPEPRSWIYLGPESWLHGWMPRLVFFRGFPIEPLQRLGLGPVTTAACLTGLVMGWHRAVVRLAAWTGLGIIVLVTIWRSEVKLGVAVAIFLIGVHAWFGGREAHKPALILPAALIPLGLALFPLLSLVIASGVVMVLWVAAKPLKRPWLREPRRLAAVACGFLVVTTYADYPMTLGIAALAVAWLASRRGQAASTLSARSLAVLSACATVVLILYPGELILWSLVYEYVPGGSAIRAVARIGLLVLLPMALGLAVLFDRLAGTRPRFAVALALICLIEQGRTTATVDKTAWRAGVADLAARIDPRFDAFYFSPPDGSWPIHKYQLDAMWAGTIRGRPTINGYSGWMPPGWAPLETPFAFHPLDQRRIANALDAWCRIQGIERDRIQWIGGPDLEIPNRNPISTDPGPASGIGSGMSPAR